MRLSLPPHLPATALFLMVLTSALQAQTLPGRAVVPATAATDTIVRLDGEDGSGRVLSGLPAGQRPMSASVTSASPNFPDTLRLPVADMVVGRAVTGTEETPTPSVATKLLLGVGPLDSLAALSAAEREQLGRADAVRHYRGRGAFWKAAGAGVIGAGTLAIYPLLPLAGLAIPAVIGARPVVEGNLRAPVPELLKDPDYGLGYRQQAQRTKRNKAWAGYGVGAGSTILLGALLLVMNPIHFGFGFNIY